MKNMRLYPKVQKITEYEFTRLLNLEEISDKDKKVLLSLQRAQRKYGILTKAKYAYFLTINNKYYAIAAMEYDCKLKVADVAMK